MNLGSELVQTCENSWMSLLHENVEQTQKKLFATSSEYFMARNMWKIFSLVPSKNIQTETN